ncbi:DUF2993 domain-containing protein [Streptomyces sp. Ru71]|uniref:LmeA family phospholipid-binding protein n=1 Tax=Streptomyces sp. Ru71 TaxID=2080746 RepID=UPI000CDE4B38|nr:DUF2993 domain-containing protein [Streptomyces sp. Ru71]POX52737.1 DUF2993 domain-containing protein [Streptomyces sp. Ru71]
MPRALRILLIAVVILGGLFAVADRVAVHFAESEAADQVRKNEGLKDTPDVSIEGFPFLTQYAAGELDDVEVGIKDYEAATGKAGQKVRIDDLQAHGKGVSFSGDYSTATAKSVTGTATVSYAELMKTAKSEPTEVAPGVEARIVGLSDGGDGKIKVAVEATLPILGKQNLSVLSSVAVVNDRIEFHADSLPALGAAAVAEQRIRRIIDFQQVIDQLPGGVKLDSVRAAPDGVEISVKGSNVRLAG